MTARGPILLIGPAATGKTAVAAHHATRVGWPVAWASLAEADVKALVEAVCAALAEALPGCSDHAARLMRGEPDPTRLLRHSAGLVAGELEALAPGGILLVLDGIDGPAGSAAACEWLEHMIAFFPPEGQLVLIGREEPPLRPSSGEPAELIDGWALGPGEADACYAALGGTAERTWAAGTPIGTVAWATRRTRPRPDAGTGPLIRAASLEAGAPHEAIAAFLQAGRLDHALRVLARVAPQLAEEAALERLDRLVMGFPPEAQGDPAWLLARGEIARLRGEVDDAEARYTAAEAAAGDDGATRGRALLGRAAIAAMRGRGPGELARGAMAAFGPEASAGRAQAECLLGVHALLAGDGEGWRRHLSGALTSFRALGDHAGAARALHNQALGHAHMGEHDAAIALYGEAVAACQLAGRLPFPLTLVNRAVLYAQAGERAAARTDAELGLRLARERGLARDAAYARWVLAKLAARDGNWPAASGLFEEALETGRAAGDAILQADALAGLAEVALRRGLPARALELVEEGTALRDVPWSDPSVYELALVAGPTLATLGRKAEARAGLARLAETMAARGESPYRRARALVALSTVDEDATRASETREQARVLAEAHGYPDLVPRPVEAPPLPTPPAELALRLFGRMEAEVDGVAVPPQRWRGPRIQLLLAFLYVERAGATREQLEAAFFGEADASRAAVALMIKRLREALEPELEKSTLSRFVLFEDGRYVLDRGRALEVDLDRFRHALDLASRADGERAIALREEALDLYRAPVLPDLDAPWLEALRESYRRQAMAALTALGTALIAAGRGQDALARAEAIARRDRTAEEPVMVRMQALAAQGRRDEAVRAARDLGARLKHELGVTPSAELEALAAKIARGGT